MSEVAPRPVLVRRISPRGPRFWFEGETLMFANQLDGSTRDGPREATDADRVAHAGAYSAALELQEADPPGQPILSARDPAVKPPAPTRPYAEKRARAAEAS